MGNDDEWEEKLHEYFEGQRMIPILMKEITADDVGKIKEKLIKYALESDEEITLLIDTNGGATEANLSLVDFIRFLGVPVKGIVLQRCKSIGVAILQGCLNRLAAPHSSFFVHSMHCEFSYDIGMPDRKLREMFLVRVKRSRTLHSQYVRIIASRSLKKEEEILKLCKQGDLYNWHFTAEEARELNLIDGIISEPLFGKRHEG